jgi:hypothetical protein
MLSTTRRRWDDAVEDNEFAAVLSVPDAQSESIATTANCLLCVSQRRP